MDFFTPDRSHFFRPLTWSRRELIATCVKALYEALYGPAAAQAAPMTRERFSEEFPEYAARHGSRVPASAQSCADVFDALLRHEEAQVARGELTQKTVDDRRRILNRWWRPHVGHVLFREVKASTLDKIADRQGWSKKTYNNAIGAIKAAFQFGARDYPERQNPAAALKYAKVAKRLIDPFSIQDAEHLVAALHADWGEAEGNFHELRFFTGMRPCEEIALLVHDYDRANGVLNINKTRVNGRDRYSTKSGRDRRVQLCPRAAAASSRQRAWLRVSTKH